jgi:hypothetical protein
MTGTTALALEISHVIGRGEGKQPADVLIAMARSGSEHDLAAWLVRTSSSLATVVQSEEQYPLLHYFHIPNDDHALPIALADLLDVATISRSLLSPVHFPTLAQGPSSIVVQRITSDHLSGGARIFARDVPGPELLEQERRRKYVAARTRLAAAGVPLREEEHAWPIYVDLRLRWDTADNVVRAHFGYPELDGYHTES